VRNVFFWSRRHESAPGSPCAANHRDAGVTNRALGRPCPFSYCRRLSDDLLWVMVEPTVRSGLTVHFSARCVPTFETKQELDG
jgi:hypothetical protein